MSYDAIRAAAAGDGPVGRVRSSFWRRLLRQPVAVACVVYLVGVVAIAFVAPIVLPGIAHEGAGDLLHVHAPPSSHHLLGTDTLGRDVLDRLLVGTRVTMLGVGEAVLVATAIGVPLGVAAGYLRGRFDRMVSWVIDLGLSVPSLIIVLVVVSVFSRSLLAAMVTMGLLSTPATARVVRAVTLPVREEPYIAAARVSGLRSAYIISRHVLPRIAGVVIVQAFLFAGGAVGITAGLAYLGVLDTSVPTWGGMIQDGISVLHIDSWLIWPPGIVTGLTVLAFTLLGDAVRDATTEAWATPAGRRRVVRRDDNKGGTATARPAHADALLSVENLRIVLPADGEPTPIVTDVTLDIRMGETVGLVGESGCGKSMTAMAILGLLPGNARIDSGNIFYDGRDLTTLSDRELARIRGKEIALVSQDPMVSLTPTFRVGWQIAQLVRYHHGVSRRAARARTLELLRQVQLAEPAVVAHRYVHELSGGMAQRVAIARALAGDPKLLIADEPTTALDVTVQGEILGLLAELKESRKMAILLITHDWGVIADLSDRAAVMYAGEIVERASIVPIFGRPLHPYTQALLEANPQYVLNEQRLPAIPGSVPMVGDWPAGCRFHPRCRYATSECREGAVSLIRPASDRETRCIHFDEVGESRREVVVLR